MFHRITSPIKAALRVAMVYALVSFAWITFSDTVLLSIFKDASQITKMQTYKGWFFVLTTTSILYFLFLRELFVKEEVKKELSSKKDFLDSLLWNIDNAVLALDSDRKVSYFNDQYLEIAPFGQDYLLSAPTIEDVLTQFCEAGLYPKEKKNELIARRLEQMEQSEPRKFVETPFLDGRTIEGFCNKLPRGGYIFTFRDITERKQLMDKQSRSSQLAALGTVAAGVAHEINNPISGVINYAALIQESPEDKEYVADLSSRIIKEGNRIATLAKDMLQYSKKGSVEKWPIELHPLIESSLSLMKPKIKRKGIEVRTVFDKKANKITVNPQRFQQIIINLLDNSYDAVKVKEMQEEEKLITVKTGVLDVDQNQYVYLEVYDNGIGMSENTLLNAKKTFFTTKPSSEGTGLGLSIVNEIISELGGMFEIESKEGEFTKGTVLIPS